MPIRSVLDRTGLEPVAPIARVEIPAVAPTAAPAKPTAEVGPSALLSDEDLTPEERRLRQAHRRRRLIWAAVIGVILAGLLFFGDDILQAVRGWQARRLAGQAGQLLEGKDWQGAYPLLRDAVKLAPEDATAGRLLAEFHTRTGSSEAISAWARVVELEPGSPAHVIRLAQAYLREGEVDLAERTLERLPPQERALPAYYEASAGVAIVKGDRAAAEAALAKWRAAEPASEFARLQTAVARLRWADAKELAAAREELRALASSRVVGRAAKRALVTDRLQHSDFEGASVLTKPFSVVEDSEFEDRLLELDGLALTGDPRSAARVAEAQKSAGEDPVRIVALARWLFSQKRYSEAFGWLRSLPASLRLRPPVAIAMADATLSIRDWAGLAGALRSQEWGRSEYLRLAFLARAAREQGRSEAANSWWKRALEHAREPFARSSLLRLATAWKWRSEVEETLWTMHLSNPRDPGPLDALEQTSRAAGNTRVLRRVARERLGFDPGNVHARRELAWTSLLLGEDLTEAEQLADELGLQHPGEAAIQAMRAWSLHLRGRTPEALALLDRVPEADRRRPEVAAVCGLLLAARGQGAQAEPFFALAGADPALLPEVRSLIEAARRGK